jgi:hypothetical protein
LKKFIRTKVIKGNEYLYEITPFFDPVTGKWRQKSRYLGKNIDGEPVRKERPKKTGQIFELGKYIPIFWADREYHIREALLSGCSPQEAATLILLAINRLISPSPPGNLGTWLSGSYLSKLIPGSLLPDDVHQVLQKISDQPLAEMFTRMFSLVNRLSDRRVLMTIQNIDTSQAVGISTDVSNPDHYLEREMVMRVQYDPVARILVGCEFFTFQSQVIGDSMKQISTGHIPGGVIVPHWDFMTPSFISRLITSGCPFIVKTDMKFDPVASHASSGGEQMYHSANIRQYHSQACYIRPFISTICDEPVQGYILHDIRREQVERVLFHKNLQNVREFMTDAIMKSGMSVDILKEIAGPFRIYFIIEETPKGLIVRKNEAAISSTLNRFGRSGVLYLGDFSWEDCFSLVDLRRELEQEFNGIISQFECDFHELRIDRIRKGVYFVSYLTVLIRRLIMNRLDSVRLYNISSFEGLMTELAPIHVARSNIPVVVPERLTRQQKTILSFFGGIPPLKSELEEK